MGMNYVDIFIFIISGFYLRLAIYYFLNTYYMYSFGNT